MARFEKIGCFGLTEPLVGSAHSRTNLSGLDERTTTKTQMQSKFGFNAYIVLVVFWSFRMWTVL